MPVLSNSRHERFAQELAKGETADAAYVTAGFKANRGNATRLKANESVVARVAEIQGKAATRAEITVAGITDRLLAIAERAETSDDAPMLQAARAALMDAAKLNGLVVDKKQVEGLGPVSVTYVTNGKAEAAAPSEEDYETD